VTVGKVQPSRTAAPVHFETVQQRTPAARTTAAVTEQKEGLADAIRNWPGWATVRARMVAVSVCDTDVYHDIQKDPIASSQARAIVAATAAATGVGAFWFGPVAIITYALMGVAGWLACAYLTHWVGTKLFTGRESEESKLWLFQLLAFAHAPRLLLFLGFFVSLVMPGFGLVLAIGAFVWALWASVPVVEETLELDQQSALLSAMTGWMAMFAIAQAAPLLIT
jgi:Yip1-like protein